MYIAIFHSWFVNSKGFEVLEIDTDDPIEAKKTALLRWDELDSTFNHTEFHLIELTKDERPVYPSTRWQKFICWVKYSHKMSYVGGGVDKCVLCGYTKSDGAD
jgi:hypothetical protein